MNVTYLEIGQYMSHTAVRTKYKGAKLRKMLIPGKTSEMLPTFRFR